MLTRKLDQQVRKLIEGIPELIARFKYRQGPDLYFYQKTIELRRKKPLVQLFEDEADRYLELAYATLVSWDMNVRGAKMKYFTEFKSAILSNRKKIEYLESFVLDKLSTEELARVKMICANIYDNLAVMISGGRLVSNSKIMHFLLPDLVMPMDGRNTLNFFYGNTAESLNKFLMILECTYYIAKEIDLKQYIDSEWNLSITKVIDNAIISLMSPKYNI
ncbi:MAG: hypothetical protein NWF11_05195 [Candidatus Bathyarchaeota archaeon]|nr:hypothetical protein [Candidatus Bathyarchaeota archaeon]